MNDCHCNGCGQRITVAHAQGCGGFCSVPCAEKSQYSREIRTYNALSDAERGN